MIDFQPMPQPRVHQVDPGPVFRILYERSNLSTQAAIDSRMQLSAHLADAVFQHEIPYSSHSVLLMTRPVGMFVISLLRSPAIWLLSDISANHLQQHWYC